MVSCSIEDVESSGSLSILLSFVSLPHIGPCFWELTTLMYYLSLYTIEHDNRPFVQTSSHVHVFSMNITVWISSPIITTVAACALPELAVNGRVRGWQLNFNCRMIDEWWTVKDLEGNGRGITELLCWHSGLFFWKKRCGNSQEGKGQTYGKLCNNIIIQYYPVLTYTLK
jgi:hypothetical protein